MVELLGVQESVVQPAEDFCTVGTPLGVLARGHVRHSRVDHTASEARAGTGLGSLAFNFSWPGATYKVLPGSVSIYSRPKFERIEKET